MYIPCVCTSQCVCIHFFFLLGNKSKVTKRDLDTLRHLAKMHKVGMQSTRTGRWQRKGLMSELTDEPNTSATIAHCNWTTSKPKFSSTRPHMSTYNVNMGLLGGMAPTRGHCLYLSCKVNFLWDSTAGWVKPILSWVHASTSLSTIYCKIGASTSQQKRGASSATLSKLCIRPSGCLAAAPPLLPRWNQDDLQPSHFSTQGKFKSPLALTHFDKSHHLVCSDVGDLVPLLTYQTFPSEARFEVRDNQTFHKDHKTRFLAIIMITMDRFLHARSTCVSWFTR